MTTFTTENPATGVELARIEADDATSIGSKLAAARVAQGEWAVRPLAERLEAVRRFRAGVVYKRDELADLLTAETGKPITQARRELDGVAPRIDFFLRVAEATLATRTVLDEGPMVEQVVSEPLGVVANISAWNYPWFVGVNVWAPALLAGNAVLYKPSELAAATGAAAASVWHEAGLAPELFAVVQGDGRVGTALVDAPVDGVFFTGSHATGRSIAERVAGRMTPVQLELGGKDPAYVADDVDVAEAAASLADGAFANGGQSCCAVERIYVHRTVHDRFVEAFVAAVESLSMGDPVDEATTLGPLTRPAQPAFLAVQVDDAVAKGAVVRTGGRPGDGPGHWFEPTVLTDVDHSMAVMTDETFGPVVGIMAVDDDDEAVALMADTPFGLTAAVYSADEGRARALLARLPTGSAYWNCCDRVSPRLPWSGRGHSGTGVTLGVEGLRAFTRPRSWHLRSPG
jgi:acyl-CoA reductase-like NAD-dependent aldehyde dehydrogenase